MKRMLNFEEKIALDYIRKMIEESKKVIHEEQESSSFFGLFLVSIF